jgi:CHAD domain-containing protein
MRRLRSAIRMFRPVLCLEEARIALEALRGLFAKLGEVRDADVFLSETLHREDRCSSRRLEEFIVAEGLLLAARIPEREIYFDLASKGLTVFDRHTKAAVEQQAWLPLLRSIEVGNLSGDGC